MMILIGTAVGSSVSSPTAETPEIKYDYSPSIQANAEGVRKVLPSTSPVILKVNIQGVIGMDDLTRHKFQELLIESREKSLKNDRVKAILLCIDSPGGTVSDADGIYHALKAYKKQFEVPVYAYVDGLCASGGMYIACAADKIYASDASLVGSIGVLFPAMFNFVKLMEKVGIDSKTLTAGKGKDEMNPFRTWQPDEGANYQKIVDDFYSIFVDIVVGNRPNVDREKLIVEYGANIFPAKKSQEIGYIDQSGFSLNETLADLAEHAGLEKDDYQVIELKEENWFRSLFKSSREMSLFRGVIKHQLELPSDIDAKLMNQYLYLYRPD